MLAGKGMWIWIVERCGEPTAIAQKAKAGGCTHLLIKLADGVVPYRGRNYGSISPRDFTMELVEACKAVGIEPVCWQYVYGISPVKEAEVVVERLVAAGLKKLVVDAEVEYKGAGMGARAIQYCQKLHALMPDIKLGLSSYRFPTYHREFPWGEFGQFMECYVPQVYWQGAHNPVEQLGRCLREYKALPYPNLPVYPAGAAYREHGWQPAHGEITDFLNASENLFALSSASLWEWFDATITFPSYWNEISNFAWDNLPEPPEPPEPPGDLPAYFIVDTASLKVRSTPEEKLDNSNFIGWTYRNAKWKPMSIAKDAYGREWWQVNGFAFVAKWLTKW